MADMATDGFTFTGQGTLDRIDTFTTGAGKTIKTLILRTGGQYPQIVPLKIFGRLADESVDWQPGNVLQVTGRLGGREWNGKVFGDNVASTVKVIGAGSAKQAPQQQDLPPPLSDDDIGF